MIDNLVPLMKEQLSQQSIKQEMFDDWLSNPVTKLMYESIMVEVLDHKLGNNISFYSMEYVALDSAVSDGMSELLDFIKSWEPPGSHRPKKEEDDD